MSPAPLPLNEADRLAALRALEILDTPNEAAFEIYPALARVLGGTPIAAVSLVDETRQWFKAISGLDIKETRREDAFCAHAIATPDEVMCVPDAEADPRFAGNPLVTGGPRIRFYAGAPIVDEKGHALGTVCMIDTRPREVSPEVLENLRNLARAVSTALQHRAAMKRLHELDALRSAAEIERQTMERQRQFISTAGHQMRTPAALIDGAAQRARARLDAGDLEGAAHQLARLRQGIARLTGMLDRLLAFESREAKRVTFRRRRFDLGELLAGVVARARRAAPDFAITLETPEASLWIKADPEMLDHVFESLIENAIKYSGTSREVGVQLTADPLGESRARVEIVDRGIGVPEADLANLFHRFFRASNALAMPGNGLGLHLARNLVVDHDGDITVASQPGQGTTVTVLLPLAEQKARDAA